MRVVEVIESGLGLTQHHMLQAYSYSREHFPITNKPMFSLSVKVNAQQVFKWVHLRASWFHLGCNFTLKTASIVKCFVNKWWDICFMLKDDGLHTSLFIALSCSDRIQQNVYHLETLWAKAMRSLGTEDVLSRSINCSSMHQGKLQMDNTSLSKWSSVIAKSKAVFLKRCI